MDRWLAGCNRIDYSFIRRELYPCLRIVTMEYFMRRRNMVEESITTEIPDTLYQRGVEFLQDKQYNEALRILGDYRDINTVLALLSLDKDQQALDILETLPESDSQQYLSAISLTRMGKLNLATDAFYKACRMNENLEFRADLDPEINFLKEQL